MRLKEQDHSKCSPLYLWVPVKEMCDVFCLAIENILHISQQSCSNIFFILYQKYIYILISEGLVWLMISLISVSVIGHYIEFIIQFYFSLKILSWKRKQK